MVRDGTLDVTLRKAKVEQAGVQSHEKGKCISGDITDTLGLHEEPEAGKPGNASDPYW
jgi:hypothetical protein